MQPPERDRTIGLVYALYFLFAIAGVVLSKTSLAAGISLQVLATLLYGALTVLIYRLFSRVNGFVATAALCASLTGCAIQAYGLVARVPQSSHLALVFFGIFCLLLGYLIVKSQIIPAVFGILLLLCGVGWLTFASPALGGKLAPVTEPLGFLTEAALMLWFLFRGV